MSRDEKRLAWLAVVLHTLWVTESWHGIGPAWTGQRRRWSLLPRVGFISGEEFTLGGVNMRTCIYVAGILGLAITVTQTGIGGVVGNALLQVMPLDKGRHHQLPGADRNYQRAELYYDRQRACPACIPPLPRALPTPPASRC